MDKPSFFPEPWKRKKQEEVTQLTPEGELRSYVSDMIAKIENSPKPDYTVKRELDSLYEKLREMVPTSSHKELVDGGNYENDSLILVPGDRAIIRRVIPEFDSDDVTYNVISRAEALEIIEEAQKEIVRKIEELQQKASSLKEGL